MHDVRHGRRQVRHERRVRFAHAALQLRQRVTQRARIVQLMLHGAHAVLERRRARAEASETGGALAGGAARVGGGRGEFRQLRVRARQLLCDGVELALQLGKLFSGEASGAGAGRAGVGAGLRVALALRLAMGLRLGGRDWRRRRRR